MNKQRRTNITIGIAILEIGQTIIRNAEENERIYLEEMPENMQDGPKAQAVSDAVDILDYAAGDIMEAIEALQGEDDFQVGDVTTDQLVQAVQGWR